jgi:hypothetical protein
MSRCRQPAGWCRAERSRITPGNSTGAGPATLPRQNAAPRVNRIPQNQGLSSADLRRHQDRANRA